MLWAVSPGVVAVCELSSPIEQLDALRKAQPQILLIEVVDPDEAINWVIKLRKLVPELRTLLLADCDDHDLELKALRGGSCGVVSSQFELKDLERALKAVANGELWVSHHVATSIIEAALSFRQANENDTGDSNRILSRREWEVLTLVSSGYRNKEVAARLGISENTVKTHLQTIYKRLHVDSRLAAALHYYHEEAQEQARRSARAEFRKDGDTNTTDSGKR